MPDVQLDEALKMLRDVVSQACQREVSFGGRRDLIAMPSPQRVGDHGRKVYHEAMEMLERAGYLEWIGDGTAWLYWEPRQSSGAAPQGEAS